MDAVTKIERVKRTERLAGKFGEHLNGGTACIIRARPDAMKASDDGMLVFVATTEALDVDDEVVIAGGVEKDSYFFRNRSCFIDHQYDMDHAIGTLRNRQAIPTASKPSGWKVGIRLNMEHRHAPMILRLAREGSIGSSIGFASIKSGNPTEDETKRYSRGDRSPRRIHRQWEWIEQSITAIPANVDAQAIGFENAKQARLDELVTRGGCPRDLAVSLGMADTPTRRKFAVADTEQARKRLMIVVDRA